MWLGKKMGRRPAVRERWSVADGELDDL